MPNILVFSVLLQHVQHCSMGILVLSGNRNLQPILVFLKDFPKFITQPLLTKSYCLVSLKQCIFISPMMNNLE